MKTGQYKASSRTCSLRNATFWGMMLQIHRHGCYSNRDLDDGWFLQPSSVSGLYESPCRFYCILVSSHNMNAIPWRWWGRFPVSRSGEAFPLQAQLTWTCRVFLKKPSGDSPLAMATAEHLTAAAEGKKRRKKNHIGELEVEKVQKCGTDNPAMRVMHALPFSLPPRSDHRDAAPSPVSREIVVTHCYSPPLSNKEKY